MYQGYSSISKIFDMYERESNEFETVIIIMISGILKLTNMNIRMNKGWMDNCTSRAKAEKTRTTL